MPEAATRLGQQMCVAVCVCVFVEGGVAGWGHMCWCVFLSSTMFW